jgi:hypothetical protein
LGGAELLGQQPLVGFAETLTSFTVGVPFVEPPEIGKFAVQPELKSPEQIPFATETCEKTYQ